MIIFAAISIVNSINKERHRMEFVITEEKPIGTFVGKLSKQRRGSQFVQFIGTEEFLTNKYSGEIFTQKVFDYEKLTKLQKSRGFHFYVLQDKVKNISVFVRVLDINDNFPIFPQSIYHINIDRNSKVGTSEKLINAVDVDEGTNAVISYGIAGGDIFQRFEVKTLNINDHENLYVNLKSLLSDGKPPDKLVLNISACDLHIHKCSHLLVNVTIIHRNNNIPKFLKEIYTAEVYENVSIGHIFLQVKAIDTDHGSNTGIEYSMWDKNKFSINPQSGDVYVQRKLDAETRVSYTLVVIAKYKGKSPKKAIAKISVTVLDCNDNPPNVSVKVLYTRGYNIIEDARIGTKVVMLSVTDIDKDVENNKVILKLLNAQGYFGLQNEGSTYSIFVNKSIDRELTSHFLLQIYASDNGIPPLCTEVKIPLEVGDINDNAPKFKNDYKVSVNESMPVGSNVTRVAAFDSDLGVNGLISYHITKTSVEKWFVVGKDTGVIYIQNALDRETASHVILEVSATDHGSPQLFSTCLINITILDSNDNNPYYESSVIVFNITENNEVPCSVGKFSI